MISLVITKDLIIIQTSFTEAIRGHAGQPLNQLRFISDFRLMEGLFGLLLYAMHNAYCILHLFGAS